ncbi:MAG: nodulation protein NfeD [Gammaproteobacteria bacterium]|nr:nodulation protein NfeD [Gammaproteobacteria bacterium]MDP6616535.1 nodulation protein NfeD [Gammaproteobacteria bacterium]
MLKQLVMLATFMLACTAQAAAGDALVIRIDSGIGPASAGFVLEGISKAEDEGYELLIIEMDTPGGLDSAMRDIIKAILASEVPVVSFVSPGGSRAASAGTYILYASHVAAMTPASNLGAATPVQIGGGSPQPPSFPEPETDEEDETEDEGDEAADAEDMPEDAMKAKMVNDAVAYIKGLAELRGRNEEWAERAVREAVSLTSSEALEQNVIDIVAEDIDDLLAQLDGFELEVDGETVTLATADLDVEYLEPDWRTRLLTIITDPSVAYLLMLAGIYGLLLEGYNPGAMVPGIVGAICLLLALFAFQVLPVNYAGLALILLGVMLMIAEGFAPSFGVLGLGGLAAFVFGSIILMDADVPGFGISQGLIGGIATAAGLLMLGMVYMLMRSRHRPVVSGAEGMIGHTAEALEDFDSDGAVFLDGERWHAVSTVPVKKGQKVQVIAVRGLIADVKPINH